MNIRSPGSRDIYIERVISWRLTLRSLGCTYLLPMCVASVATHAVFAFIHGLVLQASVVMRFPQNKFPVFVWQIGDAHVSLRRHGRAPCGSDTLPADNSNLICPNLNTIKNFCPTFCAHGRPFALHGCPM